MNVKPMATTRGIILPRVTRIEFRNFRPIFEEPVLINPLAGPFLILGGNGLGKTTMLQAIIYALAGPADEHIEEERNFRWGINYFKKRLQPDSDAEIQIEFSLGPENIRIRRGIKTDRIRGVKIANEEWIHDTSAASEEYERAVSLAGHYSSFADFQYLVHRLCYLAENRRSLLWDQRAQLRCVMLLCGDPAKEAIYHQASRNLTRADSEIRHRHVDIGHLENRIARMEERVSLSEKQAPTVRTRVDADVERFVTAQKKLSESVTRRVNALDQIKNNRSELQKYNQQLEILQKNLSQTEDEYVLNILRDVELSGNALGLHKLLIHHRCPYCTQKADQLAAEAKRYVDDNKCPICGQIHAVPVRSANVESLRSTVEIYSQQRDDLEVELAKVEHVFLEAIQDEETYRTILDELTESLPRIPKNTEDVLPLSDLASLKRTLRTYRADYLRLQIKYEDLRKDLNNRYEDFNTSFAKNLQTLKKLASEYARDFLGDPCEFIQTPAPGELHTFSFFVPRFADEARFEPEECSESERFFLDIAFRMALIELAGTLSKSSATFICETPENALDIAYTDNVAEMFTRFASKNFSLFLTGNIQAGGVAQPLLKPYTLAEKKLRIFNLIDVVVLTDVQQKKRKIFERELRRIFGAK